MPFGCEESPFKNSYDSLRIQKTFLATNITLSQASHIVSCSLRAGHVCMPRRSYKCIAAN